MIKGGKDVNLEDDSKILCINSPQDLIGKEGGPYVVVYKDTKARWVIVAMGFGTGEKKPKLGIRWFRDSYGQPLGREITPIWLVIPPDLSEIILAGLPIDDKFSSKIDKFLSGELTGLALKKWKDKWDKE